MASPEMVAKTRHAGFEVIGGGPDALAARVEREVAFNRDIITCAGIEPRWQKRCTPMASLTARLNLVA